MDDGGLDGGVKRVGWRAWGLDGGGETRWRAGWRRLEDRAEGSRAWMGWMEVGWVGWTGWRGRGAGWRGAGGGLDGLDGGLDGGGSWRGWMEGAGLDGGSAKR